MFSFRGHDLAASPRLYLWENMVKLLNSWFGLSNTHNRVANGTFLLIILLAQKDKYKVLDINTNIFLHTQKINVLHSIWGRFVRLKSSTTRSYSRRNCKKQIFYGQRRTIFGTFSACNLHKRAQDNFITKWSLGSWVWVILKKRGKIYNQIEANHNEIILIWLRTVDQYIQSASTHEFTFRLSSPRNGLSSSLQYVSIGFERKFDFNFYICIKLCPPKLLYSFYINRKTRNTSHLFNTEAVVYSLTSRSRPRGRRAVY